MAALIPYFSSSYDDELEGTGDPCRVPFYGELTFFGTLSVMNCHIGVGARQPIRKGYWMGVPPEGGVTSSTPPSVAYDCQIVFVVFEAK